MRGWSWRGPLAPSGPPFSCLSRGSSATPAAARWALGSSQRSFPEPTSPQALLPPFSSSSSSASSISLPPPPTAPRVLEHSCRVGGRQGARVAWEGRAECAGFFKESVLGTGAELPGSRGVTSAIPRAMQLGDPRSHHRAQGTRKQILGPQPSIWFWGSCKLVNGITRPRLFMKCSHGP